jgi:C-terminal processing protease CtpA/Prc
MTGEKNKHPYKGKLVIIVNEYTQSLAEYITMALATVPGAIILGSTTAGTIGEPSRIELPGGIVTAFSGYGVLYPNGRDVQRYGLKIDKVVRPTIQGIKEGKDELLDEAINLVLKKSK